MKQLMLVLVSASWAYAASCSSTSLGNGLTCYASASKASTGASTGATTSAVNTTGANLGIAVISSNQPGTGLTMTDARTGCSSPCNTWTALTSYASGTANQVTIYYSTNMTVGAGHTFSCSGTTVYCAIAVAAVGTMATSSVFNAGTDKGAHSAAAITSFQPGSITPPSGVQLIASGLSPNTYAGTTPTIDSSMTVYEYVVGAAGLSYAACIALGTQATGTAINPTWTFQSQSNIAVDIASFKTSAAAALNMPPVVY